MLEIDVIPCRDDNYAYLARDSETGEAALIDAPAAGPILERLEQKGWSLNQVLITHHHYDHVDGLADILAQHPAKVVGNAADAKRLPPLDIALNDGDSLQIGSTAGVMMDVSGHTIGHVAFHFPSAKAAFTADSLMALGCGRVFEGTMPQMHASLLRLAAMPADTLIYSGHEYTQSNARFALSVDPDNLALKERAADIDAKRATGLPTVPATLSLELQTNPFLRSDDPGIRAHLDMKAASAEAVFTEIRKRKDNF